MEICIQNAVPAFLVHRRHCVVQQRVRELIELTTISRIPLAKPPKVLAANKLRNSISFLGALKVLNTVERFE